MAESETKKSGPPAIHAVVEKSPDTGKVKAPPPEQSLSPSALDLTTLQNVKDYLGVTGTGDDNVIQGLITALGTAWLWWTGLGNQNRINTQSPFNSQVTYSEVYDGNGSPRMYLRNRPIISVVSLSIDGVVMQASTGYPNPGYVIDGNAKSIVLINGGGPSSATFSFNYLPGPSCGGWWFKKGLQNVSVQYTAGYSTTPFDVELAAKQIVATTYQRKKRRDQTSQAMAQGAGTIAFRDWSIPPEAREVINAYRRDAIL